MTQQAAFVAFCEKNNLQMAKWSSAASLIQQPADVGRMHQVLHKYFAGQDYENEGAPSDAMLRYLERVFDKCKLSQKTKRRFRKCLEHIESALNSGFTIKNIQKAWRLTGLRPFDPLAIFSRFLGWPKVPQAVADAIFKCVFVPVSSAVALPYLSFNILFTRVHLLLVCGYCHRNLDVFATRCLEVGNVSDEFIAETLNAAGVDMSVYNMRGADEKKLDELAINRRRCCWLNSPGFRAAELERKRVKTQAAADLLAAKVEKVAKQQANKDAAVAKQATKVVTSSHLRTACRSCMPPDHCPCF